MIPKLSSHKQNYRKAEKPLMKPPKPKVMEHYMPMLVQEIEHIQENESEAVRPI